MSITPNITRPIENPICWKCGQFLHVNNQAIVHEHMHDGQPLVIGDCCADLIFGALIQDFRDALTIYSFATPSHWIKTGNKTRAQRIISALHDIAMQYECSINTHDIEAMQHLIGGDHEQ